jgi:[protein-PII] uridylyltransferase
VRRFARQHGLSRADGDFVAFLVRGHLLLSHTAQKEDLSDPDVVAAFAAKVGDARRLTALYLLTVADIRGTSPKVWNAWKGKLLEDLYRLTLRHLGGATVSLDAVIEARKAEARQQLALKSALPGTEEPLWATLQVSYFARHDASELAWHARMLWRHLDSQEPVVCARPSPIGEGLQVLVFARDVPDLFARICGYFDGAGFNIQDAKVHTTRKGYALDTFQVQAQDLEAAQRDLVPLVEQRLGQALRQTGPLPEPRRARLSRRVKSFPTTPRVQLRPRRARPGLGAVALGQRPRRPALRGGAGAGTPRGEPAAGQDLDAGRARRGQFPGQRRGAVQPARTAADRERAARRAGAELNGPERAQRAAKPHCCSMKA